MKNKYTTYPITPPLMGCPICFQDMNVSFGLKRVIEKFICQEKKGIKK